jgi:predicted ATPase
MTGFGSADYFSKCFHNYFGYPPVEAKNRTFDTSDSDNRKKGSVREESRNLLKNFPGQTTSFIGRDKEIGTIINLIEKHRIVTLTGTGGCGKTRLACEVAAQLVKYFPDDIWFVDLAPVEAEEFVIKQLMTTLILSEAPGRDMMDIVVEGIKDKKLLILLDNCEHLIRTCAAISHKLIESVSGLSLLVTSREALNIKCEKIWLVPSLTLPDPKTVIDVDIAGKSEAVSLFTDRARLNNSGFELVEKNASTVSTICHRVDGIPLAIELVASRTRYMDTLTLLNRLSERFDTLPSLDQSTVNRHKTIQAAIEWSYHLLTEKEKALFRHLSVFSGGFDLDAAEEVCANENLPKEIIPDLLFQLVDKSMIQTVYLPGQAMRYKLLETLQRFASNLLAEMDEDVQSRKRHLEYFTGIAEQAYQEQFESQLVWLTKLKQENYNLNSALNWADQNCPEEFSILVGYLSWF